MPTSTTQDVTVRDMKSVEIFKASITSASYFMLIDLDNGGGGYRHKVGATKLHIYSCTSKQAQVNNTDEIWNSFLGVILDIDGTDAVIQAPCPCALATSPGQQYSHEVANSFPNYHDCTVVNNRLRNWAGTPYWPEGGRLAAVNTATPMTDVEGNSITPAVGDVILAVVPLTDGASDGVIFTARCIQYIAY